MVVGFRFTNPICLGLLIHYNYEVSIKTMFFFFWKKNSQNNVFKPPLRLSNTKHGIDHFFFFLTFWENFSLKNYFNPKLNNYNTWKLIPKWTVNISSCCSVTYCPFLFIFYVSKQIASDTNKLFRLSILIFVWETINRASYPSFFRLIDFWYWICIET